MLKQLFIAAALILVCGHVAQAQPVETWSRTAFEAGVTYTETDPIATDITNCTSDNFSNGVSWTEGAPLLLLKSTAVAHTIFYNGANRAVVDAGSYTLFASGQRYPPEMANQTVTATIVSTLHCLDATGTYLPRIPATLSITPRIPLKQVRMSARAVKGGTPFTVIVVITAPAGAANTRVDLKWTGATALLPGPPTHLDVPVGKTTISLVVPTIVTTTPQTIRLTASTLAQPQEVSIRVTP